MLPRRSFLRCFVSALGARGVANSLEVERIVRDYPLQHKAKHSGSYRADAAVLFLGMTVLRRKQVGGGFLSFQEAQSENERRLDVTFKAGSLRDRAGGLNRVGYIQEVCVEHKSILREAAYFGIMTSSPEESFADAKSAIENQSKDSLRYTAIDGVNVAGRARSASHRWTFPPEFDWSRSDALVSTALEKTRSAAPKWRQVDLDAASTPETFFYVILRALRGKSDRSEAKYVFGAETFRLTTERRPESNGSVRLKGEILNEMTGKKTSFSALFLANATLPSRIDFQPRSYLRLSFEAV